MLGFPFPPRRRGYWILAFLDKDLDHVGEEAIEFRISALALGDGIHFPALVDELGKEVVRFVIPRQRNDLNNCISVSGGDWAIGF